MGKTQAVIKGTDAKGKFTKGNTAALKTGIYSKIFSITGKVPSVRGAKKLQAEMEALTADLEAITPEINAKKVLMIKQIVRTETLMRLIELYMKQHGILQPFKARKYIMELQPAMSGTYLSLLSQQRSSLMALGLNTGQTEEVLAPYEIVEKEEREKARLSDVEKAGVKK